MLFLFIFLHFYNINCENINAQYSLNNARAFLTATTLPYHSLAFFAGGQNNDLSYCNLVNIYNATSNTWSLNYLSIARGSLASTSLPKQGLVFFAGGCYQQGLICPTNVDILDISTNTWNISYLSIGRADIKAESLPEEGLVFFAGGSDQNGNTVNVVDIFNYFDNKWTNSTLTYARYFFASASLPNHGLVFFGGGSNNIYVALNTVEIYNAKNKSWSIQYLSVGRISLVGASLYKNGLVFFAGGYYLINNFSFQIESAVVDIYNISSQNWTTALLSQPRDSISASSLQEQGLVFFGGGTNFEQDAFNTVDIYNVINNEWTVATLKIGKWGLISAPLLLQGFVLFVGGIPFTGDVQVFSSCLGGTSSSLLTTKTDKQCNICPAGTYANTGSLQCMICPPGNFCPYEGTTSPIPAPSGWYIPSAGSVVQYSYMCEYAYYCPTGSVNQILCPAGSYCNTVAMQYPNNCSFGYYNNKVGSYSQSDCIICPAGYYCNKEIGASDIIPCPAGKYCSEGTVFLNVSCPAGYYCPYATPKLFPCPIGSYCPESSSFPVSCSSGYYCPEKSANMIGCNSGYQCPAGAVIPEQCPVNYFSSSLSGNCQPCKSGEFTREKGSATCISCPSSKFSLDGWWCMTTYDKIIFVGIWVLTFLSGIISFVKIIFFIKKRRKDIVDKGYPITIKTFLFLERYKKKRDALFLELLDNREIAETIYQEMLELKKTISKMEKKISDFENK